jgi:hypothetical protein
MRFRGADEFWGVGIGVSIYRSMLDGVLGIHRPYLSDADLKAAQCANQAMESATQIRTIVETYLREMGVPGMATRPTPPRSSAGRSDETGAGLP